MSSDDESPSQTADQQANRNPCAVNISTELPPDIPGTGYSFAPYSARSSDVLISADAALAAAQATGIMADAWTQGVPTAALARYTNTLNRTAVDLAVWVITTIGAASFNGGPSGHRAGPHPYTRLAEWIIDATTGTYVGATARGI